MWNRISMRMTETFLLDTLVSSGLRMYSTFLFLYSLLLYVLIKNCNCSC